MFYSIQPLSSEDFSLSDASKLTSRVLLAISVTNSNLQLGTELLAVIGLTVLSYGDLNSVFFVYNIICILQLMMNYSCVIADGAAC